MLTWGIPPEDWESLTVKTTRLVPGTQRWGLLQSDLPTRWSLEIIAQKYGPGTYRITAGAGPYRGLNSTVTVTPEYAREAGWEPAPAMPPPQPSPQDLLAARTFNEATRGPVDPVALAAMIQTAVDNALARTRPVADADPFTLMMKGFELATTMSTKSLETAKTMMGVAPTVADNPSTWADVALQLGPSLLGTLQQLVAKPQPAQPRAPQPPPPQQPQVLAHHAQVEEQTMEHAQPVTAQIPPLAAPLLNIMKQYAPMLRGHLESPIQAEELAAQLAGLLGADLDPSVHAVANHVRQRGPGILAHADPALATPKAVEVLGHWSDLLAAQEHDAQG